MSDTLTTLDRLTAGALAINGTPAFGYQLVADKMQVGTQEKTLFQNAAFIK